MCQCVNLWFIRIYCPLEILRLCNSQSVHRSKLGRGGWECTSRRRSPRWASLRRAGPRTRGRTRRGYLAIKDAQDDYKYADVPSLQHSIQIQSRLLWQNMLQGDNRHRKILDYGVPFVPIFWCHLITKHSTGWQQNEAEMSFLGYLRPSRVRRQLPSLMQSGN